MEGFITYLRTATEMKSLCSLGFKKVIDLLKSRKINVRLRVFMQQILMEKKKDIKYLSALNEKLIHWQDTRDKEGKDSAALVYHHTGAHALKGFRYEKINYAKKDREIYHKERRSFSRKERPNFIKYIASERGEELLSSGFSKDQIVVMKNEGRAPVGYEVHHRVPLDDGGDNSRENLILIRDDVEHRCIHGYYNAGELTIKHLNVGDCLELTLPVPPKDSIVYPNCSKEYTCEKIPNSALVELYDEA